MTEINSITKWIWVVAPIAFMLLFQEAIFVVLNFFYGDHINPEIFFYLPFLSLVPPLILFLIWYGKQRKDSTAKLIIAHREKVGYDIVLGIGIGIVAILVFIGCFAFLRSIGVSVPNFSSFSPAHHIYFSTIGALVPGIAEELYFRGLLSQKLKNFSPALVIIISALSFSLWHILSPPYLLHTFLLGITFGLTYHHTKRLLPVMIAHSLANMSVGVLILQGYI